MTPEPTPATRNGQVGHVSHLALAALITGGVMLASAPAARAKTKDASRSVVCTVLLRNVTDRPLQDVALRVPVPRTNEYQQIHAVTIIPKPAGFRKEDDGNVLSFFTFDEIVPGASVWVAMLIHCTPETIEAGRAPPPSAMSARERGRYLGRGYKVDPRHPAIRAAAGGFRRDAMNDYDVVSRINSCLSSEFTYELDGHQLDAAQVLRSRSGSCSELSRLFVALARSCGIPARLAYGSRLRSESNGYVDTVHHRWVETWIDDYGWLPVDISLNVSGADPEKRFGNMPPRYLSYIRNAGIPGDPIRSGQLALVSHDHGLDRAVNSYWYKNRQEELDAIMDTLGNVLDAKEAVAAFRDRMTDLHDPCAVPFLHLLLCQPFPESDRASVIDALTATAAPAAVVPLIECARSIPEHADRANVALQTLTDQNFRTAAEWDAWLLDEGLDYLRGNAKGN